MNEPGKPFDYEDAYQILRLVEASPTLRRINIEVGDFTIDLEREFAGDGAGKALNATDGNAVSGDASAPEAAPSVSQSPSPTGAELRSADEEDVLTPMAGIFYRAPSPGADPFVAVGSHVQKGDTIGIVEVMKLMNTVSAPVTGTVADFLVDDSAPVQFDQPLARIRRDV